MKRQRLVRTALALALILLLSACGQLVSIMPGTEVEHSVASAAAGALAEEGAGEPRPVMDFLG